jgi:hypothetical protein
MRIKTALKTANWAAAATGILILALVESKDFAFFPFVLLLAAALHLLIDSAALLRRGAYARRLGDLREFSGHQGYATKDLEATLSGEALMRGVLLPAIVEGEIRPRLAKGGSRRAPLSGSDSLAWRLEAELLEGLAEVPGPTLVVDSFWGAMELRDEAGSIALGDRGVLDAGGWTEKRLGVKGVEDMVPAQAERIKEGLGLTGDTGAAKAKILLREVALLPGDRARVYGTASRPSSSDQVGLRLEGSDTLDDPASLLVRDLKSPASSRMPRATGRALALGLAGILLAGGALGLALGPVEKVLAKPGGILDLSRSGAVLLDLDGRPTRIALAGQSWDFESGDSRKGFQLFHDDKAFSAPRGAPLAIYDMGLDEQSLANGDASYPRWDGSAWILETGQPAQAAGKTGTEPAGAADPGGPRTGRLYIRNLSKEKLSIRSLDPGARDLNWTFTPLEAAQDPAGHYLSYSGGGEPSFGPSSRVEILLKDGSRRVLSLERSAAWKKTGSWLLELAPELLAGSGKLFVANRGDRPLRIWIIGADGASLYGSEPWTFDAKEGSSENRGLSLQNGDKDIIFTGRERIRLVSLSLKPRFTGSLEAAAAWKKGRWSLDLAKSGS